MNTTAFVSGVMLSAGTLAILLGINTGNPWQAAYGFALAAWAIDRIITRKGTIR